MRIITLESSTILECIFDEYAVRVLEHSDTVSTSCKINFDVGQHNLSPDWSKAKFAIAFDKHVEWLVSRNIN